MKTGARILGIDPGTNMLGFCLLVHDGKTYKIEKIGCLRLPRTATHIEKLSGIVTFISELIQQVTPDHLAIEEPFYGKNVQSMLKLGRAQGAVMSIALLHGIPVTEITPRRVKQSVTGSGAASKEQVAAMVERITGIDLSTYNPDATDAAAIAIAFTLSSSPIVPPVEKSKSKNPWADYLKNNPDKLIS